MFSRYHLSDRELQDLEFEYRHTADKRYVDRVKTVYLLGKGWLVTKIAEALLIDRETSAITSSVIAKVVCRPCRNPKQAVATAYSSENCHPVHGKAVAADRATASRCQPFTSSAIMSATTALAGRHRLLTGFKNRTDLPVTVCAQPESH